MERFTDIGQFREIIRAIKSNHDYKGKDENEIPIYNHDSNYPILTFKGTVKLHGTSSAIVLYTDNTVKYQSRERELSLEQDNSGFMLAMLNKAQSIVSFNTKLFKDIDCSRYIALYGEWCGKGIQSGVAISQLPKMFVIFGLKIDDIYYDINDYHWLPEVQKEMNDNGIYLITQFENYEIEIDFNHPEMVQNKLGEITLEVEKQCPVGKFFFDKVMISNVAYEENDKIWFDKENGFTDKFKELLIERFKEIRVKYPIGVNYIKFTYIK